MKINGELYPTLAVFPIMMTVPDCIVTNTNKIGTGHGEAKFYVSSKEQMHDFYGGENFKANCIMLKSDLLAYMTAVKNEYINPSQNYRGKDEMPSLWEMRYLKVCALPDVIEFVIDAQDQISGPRGYINSSSSNYQLIREIALPLVSYICAEKIGDINNPIFYWKLFVDFDAIWEKQNGPLVLNYGKGESSSSNSLLNSDETNVKKEIHQARNGQGKYREQLIEQCPYCPITMISDERLLIASHIKPWAACNDEEKVDPYNGYLLSPLYDKLFDRGYITFTEDRHIVLSEFISSYTWKQINLKNGTFYQALPMDDKRIEYLDFHHKSVFKGQYLEMIG